MTTIDSAMQGRGTDSRRLVPHWQGIKRAFGEGATTAISSEVEEITFILRIDGNLGSFGADGLDNFKINLRHKYVSADICIPTSRWVNASNIEIARFIADCIMGSAPIIAAGLAKRKIECDLAILQTDLKRGCDKFLALFHPGD